MLFSSYRKSWPDDMLSSWVDTGKDLNLIRRKKSAPLLMSMTNEAQLFRVQVRPQTSDLLVLSQMTSGKINQVLRHLYFLLKHNFLFRLRSYTVNTGWACKIKCIIPVVHFTCGGPHGQMLLMKRIKPVTFTFDKFITCCWFYFLLFCFSRILNKGFYM